MIDLDLKEYEKYISWFETTGPKTVIPRTVRGFLNDIAFLTKEKSKGSMDKQFNYKSAGTKRYLQRAVYVQKAKNASVSSMESEVGIPRGGEDTRARYNREILSRQEKGGKLKQVRAGGSRYRSWLMVPATVGKKRTIRFRRQGLVRPNNSIKNNRQRMAHVLKHAREKKIKYAVTPYGIYRVLAKRARAVRYFKESGSIQTPRKVWLLPATHDAVKQRDRIFLKNLNRQLKKHGLK